MRLRRNTADESGESVEHLLMSAADWQPRESAPVGLLSAAPTARSIRSTCRRRLCARAVFASMFACACASVCVVRYARNDSDMRRPVLVRTAQSIAAAVPAGTHAPEVIVERGRSEPRVTAVASQPTGRHQTTGKGRSIGRRHRAPTGSGGRKGSPVWREYTVKRYVSGFSTPGYVAARGDDGSTVLLPAVADVALCEHTGAWSADAVKPIDYVPVSYQTEGNSHE